MKKRIILMLLISIFFTANFQITPVSALDGESVIIQMGGPVSSIYGVDTDSLIKRYATSQAYEARYYPFGEGNGAPEFIGTATYVRDLNKTDLEIALLEAIKKSGTDLDSLKKYHEYVEKYEATCGLTAEALNALVMEAAGNALSTTGNSFGFAGADLPSAQVGVVNITMSLGSAVYDTVQGEADVNTAVGVAFTMADVANTAGSIVIATANSQTAMATIMAAETAVAVGSVASMGAAAWTSMMKYLEYREEWRDFVNYLNGRKNLTEFFKWLDAELADKMKETTGWDIFFNNAEDTWTEGFWGFDEMEITGVLYARFMHNYVPEFSVGSLGDTNGDGWTGRMELTMSADLSLFQESYPNSIYDMAGSHAQSYEKIINTVFVDYSEVIEEFYWYGTLTSKTFPLKTESISLEQPQIVFTGPLSNCDYVYRQGGEYKSHFYGAYIFDIERIDYESQGHFTIDHDGMRDHFSIHDRAVSPRSFDIMVADDINHEEKGDIFSYDMVIPRVSSKMVIDLTKPKGIVYELQNE